MWYSSNIKNSLDAFDSHVRTIDWYAIPDRFSEQTIEPRKEKINKYNPGKHKIASNINDARLETLTEKRVWKIVESQEFRP